MSPLGRTVAVLAIVCWVAGARWGWKELLIVASISIALLLIGALFTIGQLDLTSQIGVEPSRVVVGDRAAGSLTLHNNRSRAARSLRVELPVGKAAAVYSVPHLDAGGEVEELFVVPTNRRAIIPVGPVATVQGDPLGLFRRTRVWSSREEIYVHPITTGLSTIASGLVRDLEGQTTPHLSPSDIAFHTLRDYVPGDDRRHVHWKSSAKNGRLLVRQYVDTRRSHLAVLLSIDLDEYASEDEFELAVSCAASVAAQALRDEQTLSLFVGDQQLPTLNPRHMLDLFSGIEVRRGGAGIDRCLRKARNDAPDASVVVVCLGSTMGVPEFRKATARIAMNTSTMVLRADLAAKPGYRVVGNSRFVNVPELRMLNRGIQQVLS
ncbi:MAG: DUF58 domain-containing protein [Ilumatobacteraceae bacterium]